MDLLLVIFLITTVINGVHGIVGGTNAEITSFPFMASIEEDGGHICGATIISTRYVLSAAHCIYDRPTDHLKIRVGTNKRGIGGSLHEVTNKLLHKSYHLNNFGNSMHDIALLSIKETFKFNNACKPIKLSRQMMSEQHEFKVKVIVLGWGALQFSVFFNDNSLPDNLQVLQLPLISKSSCANSYKAFDSIDKGQICAGYTVGTHEPGKDICDGDSGGPLVLNGTQIGIAAYSRGTCGLFWKPSVYTEVAYFYNWIKKHARLDD